MKNLDFYAHIEPMIGFYEAYEDLYSLYLELVDKDTTLLDVGSGNGRFLERLQEAGVKGEGIDLSHAMVERAKMRGVDVRVANVCDMTTRYATITAIADVLNYMDEKTLDGFIKCISKALDVGGKFICDINTKYGFEEVAQGQFFVEEENRTLCVEAHFEDDRLMSDFTLFEADEKSQAFSKTKASIIQYYHPQKRVQKLCTKAGLKEIGSFPVTLFGEESDKTLLIFEKVA